MLAGSTRRMIAAITALLFLLSIAVHGFVVAGMAGDENMSLASASSDMGTPGAGKNCGMDCAKDIAMHMACSALCASLTGILSEPVSLPLSFAAEMLPVSPSVPLTSVHGPPDPYPPKSVLT